MSEAAQIFRKGLRARARRTFILGDGFAPVAEAMDTMLIVSVALICGVLYHHYVYGDISVLRNYVPVGILAALFYVAPLSMKKQYDVSTLLANGRTFRHIFHGWTVAVLCVLAIGFVAKITQVYSRGAIILFYLTGLVGLVALRAATAAVVRYGFRQGWLVSKRLFLIGTPARVRAFRERFSPTDYGLQIADVEILPEAGQKGGKKHCSRRLRAALERTVEKARTLAIDTIVLLIPWSETGAIEACREAFLKVPAVTVLGPELVLGRALEAGVHRVGPAANLTLVRAPLNIVEIGAKRVMDLVVAAVSLVALSPLLLIVALLIKLDGRGPVFFLQHRHGFNQKPFRIIKFRTMTVAEDGHDYRQVTANDPRVTRLGRFLRRWNIDELPQLINVIKGDMSIIGPRPHPLVQNHEFEKRIALYARRHNVKPGITGWAQVNGYRGETDTDEKMRGRIEHDLYYIDNWSIWFDLQIMLMTLFSRRAFLNAY